VDEARSAVAP